VGPHPVRTTAPSPHPRPHPAAFPRCPLWASPGQAAALRAERAEAEVAALRVELAAAAADVVRLTAADAALRNQLRCPARPPSPALVSGSCVSRNLGPATVMVRIPVDIIFLRSPPAAVTHSLTRPFAPPPRLRAQGEVLAAAEARAAAPEARAPEEAEAPGPPGPQAKMPDPAPEAAEATEATVRYGDGGSGLHQRKGGVLPHKAGTRMAYGPGRKHRI